MGTGDFLSQVFVEKTEAKDYNFLRTAKFAGFGLCVAVSSRDNFLFNDANNKI